MGLDMYLYRKNANRCTDEPEEHTRELAYWRKANQIRGWFSRNVQGGIENCVDSPVSKELLEKLIVDCNTVINSPELAKNVMPTEEGFFFGGVKYDEYYFATLRDTVEMVEEALHEIDWSCSEVVYYEWW